MASVPEIVIPCSSPSLLGCRPGEGLALEGNGTARDSLLVVRTGLFGLIVIRSLEDLSRRAPPKHLETVIGLSVSPQLRNFHDLFVPPSIECSVGSLPSV